MSDFKRESTKVHLCPDAVAKGDGPLGGRGSSHVLISIITLSRDWKNKYRLTTKMHSTLKLILLVI